jgi:hypothetical protein
MTQEVVKPSIYSPYKVRKIIEEFPMDELKRIEKKEEIYSVVEF